MRAGPAAESGGHQGVFVSSRQHVGVHALLQPHAISGGQHLRRRRQEPDPRAALRRTESETAQTAGIRRIQAAVDNGQSHSQGNAAPPEFHQSITSLRPRSIREGGQMHTLLPDPLQELLTCHPNDTGHTRSCSLHVFAHRPYRPPHSRPEHTTRPNVRIPIFRQHRQLAPR